MTLQPQPIQPVPVATVAVAKAAFPNGNLYLQLRDALGTIYDDTLFTPLYPRDGQPAISPWRLALVTVLQFAEDLPDRQAADAVRSRIDWKYLLGLELTDPGFDYSVLCEFRARLIAADATDLLLDRLLQVLQAHGLLKRRSTQRTDSTHILAAVRDLSRLEFVGTAVLQTLNTVALVAPNWLERSVPHAWAQRYRQRWEDYRLPPTEAERLQLGEQVAQDGYMLLNLLYAADAPAWLRQIPAVETLRQVWLQNFYLDNGTAHWRHAGNIPPAAKAICSPFDTEARYNIKRQTAWTGYKVHLTETCGPDAPHLIVHVLTTVATEQDNEVVTEIHQALAAKDVLPNAHLVDQGYSDSQVLSDAQDTYDIEMVMPIRAATSWQAKRADAYDLSHFQINWAAQSATCPEGKTSASWVQRVDKYGHAHYDVQFNTCDCAPCPVRNVCTRSKRQRRKLTIRPQQEHERLQAARAYQQTDDFQARYAARSGIEGTLAQAVVALDMRRSRYRGLAKTHVQHVATATGVNIKRLVNWWNDVPLAKTKPSRFAALMTP